MPADGRTKPLWKGAQMVCACSSRAHFRLGRHLRVLVLVLPQAQCGPLLRMYARRENTRMLAPASS